MLSHIAVIMDGNGRWARKKTLPRTAGHKAGAESAREIIKSCVKHKIRYLTLYAFSSENWNRPEDEVKDLMGLLKFYLGKELDSLHKNGVCVKIIGDRARLSNDIREKIEKAELLTGNNSTLTLQVALSYGSRQEITHAVQAIAQKVEAGTLSSNAIDEDLFARHLYTSPLPDPDLLIRTGGEQRISNYLLWQCAYTEFYFTDTLWPDFRENDLVAAIDDFYTRERRFGRVLSPEKTTEQEKQA